GRQVRGRRPVPPATWLRHPIMLPFIGWIGSPCAGVRLVDQPNDPRAVVHADPWRFASLPAVERVAQRSEIERGDGGAREDLVAIGSRKLHDSVLHCEDGVAACDLPLAVGPVAGEAVADLHGTENAAR